MQDLAFVLEHVKAGKKIRIYTDVFGASRVEFKTGWFWLQTARVELEHSEVSRLKDALRHRRATRVGKGDPSQIAVRSNARATPATTSRARS